MIHRAINRLTNLLAYQVKQLEAANAQLTRSFDATTVKQSLISVLELSIFELERALVELSHISPPVAQSTDWIEP